MRAMVHRSGGTLEAADLPIPPPGPKELRVRVDWCGVCRTDLHVVDEDLPPRKPAVVPGHEVVGHVDAIGRDVRSFSVGGLVGVPWLHRTCGVCEYCLSGRENLCVAKEFTGYSVDGGYAEYVLSRADYTLPLAGESRAESAPFLCAGIIGYRAFQLARPADGGRIGFFGFGGSAHLALQLAVRLGFETVAYSRSPAHLKLASDLGAREAVLVGAGSAAPREPHLDGAVVFAPSGAVVLQALAALKRGGTVSIAAIHLSPIPPLDYDRLLFGERRIVSVEANTRDDAREFLDLAREHHLESRVKRYPLEQAGAALDDLRRGQITGAAVLDCRPPEARTGRG